MDEFVVGIDLGTTFSAVAYVDEAGEEHVICNNCGNQTTPSVVLIEGDQVRVGEIALNQWVTNEEHVIRWIKRAIGDEEYRFQGRSPVEISAEILKVLKADAEQAVGRPVDAAVVTCPAYFAAQEIENTKKAGELAGLHVREIVKEPTAAAVYYGVHNMAQGETVLVCDLGGGTYDATVLTLQQGQFVPLATKGDRKLGGHDWTTILTEMVAEQLLERCGDDPRNDLVAGQMLYEACEKAKRDFARVAEVRIFCPCNGKTEEVLLSRAEFERRTEFKIQEVVAWSREALAKATPPLKWSDLHRVLLVGGSSRLRRFSEALHEESGIMPIQISKPDLAVALGAAMIAKGKVRSRNPGNPRIPGGLTEVNPLRALARSVGTRTVVFATGAPRICNTELIPRNVTLPVTKTRDGLVVSVDRQAHFDVPVVEYEDDDTYDQLGNFRFQCPPDARRGDPIRLLIDYDISGIPTVDAVYLKSGQSLPYERFPYEEPDLTSVKIWSKPRWVVFALDTSGSMAGAKLMEAKRALIERAEELLAAGLGTCRVGLVSFASDAHVVCEPTTDLDVIKRAVAGMTAGGTTAMDAAIGLALNMVQKAPHETVRDVVMITDGYPDDHRRQQTLTIAGRVREENIRLSALGLGAKEIDLDFLKELTPHSLVIELSEGISDKLGTLLTQTEQVASGLEGVLGGLTEAYE